MYALAPRRKQQGHPDWGALEGQVLSRLRQVVAERCPEHVVGTFGVAARVGRAARTGPEIALEVAVLDALAKTAHGTAVEVVPVPGTEFLDILVVASAVGGGRWSESISAIRRGGAGQ